MMVEREQMVVMALVPEAVAVLEAVAPVGQQR